MKYGLLYFKETANIGDDIQTYAAKRFLPRVDYWIDRENLNCFVPDKKELVSVIMNSWYIHNKAAWPPSPYINPLITSAHFTTENLYDIGGDYLTDAGLEYLKKYEPIGSRDSATNNLLKEKGIQTFFSGCMTLTINRFNNVKKEDYICIVDTNQDVIDKVKESTNKEIRIISNARDSEEMSNKSTTERMEDVEKLLKQYQGASLIITDRLHATLPSIALGTPVILLRNGEFGKDRINDFEKFVKNYEFDKFLNMNIKEVINNPEPNKTDYIEIRNRLIKSCEQFIKESKKITNIDDLPDVKEYKKNIAKFEYNNKIYLLLKEKLAKANQEIYNGSLQATKNMEDAQNLIKQLNKELLKKDTKLESLQSELEKIYNSRTWKIRNLVRKIIKGNK